MLAATSVNLTKPITIAIVADQTLTRDVLVEVLIESGELDLLGATTSVEAAERLLEDPRLRVILVNLSLSGEEGGPPPGVAFIRAAKARRPDVGVLSLKRTVDEPHLRAALDAGADACCLVTTPVGRLRQAIAAVAEGATWLDPEISRVLLRPKEPPALPHLSPRERAILSLIVDGSSNAEIAAQLGCATATIHTHILRLFKKLGVRHRVSAAVCALRAGLV
ncbi:MAG: two component transcriptional regulator, LuxR family [Candidatus Eremiobacteraeota bacterium]|nr:two component transcriptional regulator, LuxR family [Candidatus Eremiobacteraeota bacterium]